MVNYVLTSDIYKGYKHAGPKAKADINKFLADDGWKILDLDLPIKRIPKLIYRFSKLPKLFKGKDIQNIIFQYPMYSVFLTKSIIKEIRRQTNANIIFVIHDYESIRKYKGDTTFFKNEVEIFNSVDCLIVHSVAMKNEMRKNGIKTKMVILGLFDYYNPQPLISHSNYDHSICFAGNLEKSSFLTKLTLKDSHAYLFGMDPASNYPQNISYEGLYQAEELPKHLKGDFGLVWDGTTLNGDGGIYADYQRFNAPHKASLYVSSGMPVIVSKKAAISDFVIDNKIGIAVDSLNNLDTELYKITETQYLQMQNNTKIIAKKLRNGLMIKNAISTAINIISNK
ncbi:galactofuranosyltransferase [Ligilactobacillus cholophilus]|uniref:galactofuranosyltransferase n=1 Tax=Ligilactobacillus cholophilus TaxID=3050131 RepID=UPI0025AFD9BB|nr:galactofuranosyltransferase [Ligilactobacillus cholophilus]